MSPLGAILQVGSSRFRVIGVMAAKGQVLGFDLDDTVFIPTARALEVFNREGVMEIQAVYPPEFPVNLVTKGFTTYPHQASWEGRFHYYSTKTNVKYTFYRLESTHVCSRAALGGISLLVGAVGMVTLMHITVTERVAEIGLLNALGATQARVGTLFLLESTILFNNRRPSRSYYWREYCFFA